MKKPTLVINCSDDKKTENANNNFDLYLGGIYQLIRANISNVFDYFDDVLILSAKYGLISGKGQSVGYYNERMCSRRKPDMIEEFSQSHHKQAKALLLKQSKASDELFVLMTKDYMAAFDAMFDDKPNSVINKFQSSYILRGHEGIGELRGAMKQVLNYVVSGDSIGGETYFRSGIANINELGFVGAGCDVGSSLAHVTPTKMPHLLGALLDATKHVKLFLDNGLITAIRKGHQLDYDDVFNQYEMIIDSLPRKQAKNVSIVVPDSVDSNEEAIAILKRFKTRISALSKKCRVIVPIHKSSDMKSHTLAMFGALGFNKRITIGIPCLQNKDVNIALSLEQIERILWTKHPQSGQRLVSSIHFFGMSDATAKSKLNPRLLLAHINGLTGESISLDACRTTAVFGHTKKGYRKGSQIIENMKRDHQRVTKSECETTQEFISHGLREEHVNKQRNGIVLDRYFDMISDDNDLFTFWDVLNQALIKNGMVYITQDNDRTEDLDVIESLREKAWDYVSQPAIELAFFEYVKGIDWKVFASYVIKSPFENSKARYDAIKQLFMKTPVPVQGQLAF